jgi:hypothetical protein
MIRVANTVAHIDFSPHDAASAGISRGILLVFWINELRRPIVVVTNQFGFGRGYFDDNACADLTRWMRESL